MPTIEITEHTLARLEPLTSPLFNYNNVIERLLDMAEVANPTEQDAHPNTHDRPQATENKMTNLTDTQTPRIPHTARAPRGESIDRETYARHLLAIITKWGGKAGTRRIKPELLQRLQHQFSAIDLDHYEKNADQQRWWNHVRFVRQELIERDLFIRGSAHGIWETTEAGARLGQLLIDDIDNVEVVVLFPRK